MTARTIRGIAGLSVVLLAHGGPSAAELGDVNGDGRVSFGDAFLLRQWRVTGLELFRPAAGSTAFGEFFPCASDHEAGLGGFSWQMLVFHEALRRAVADPLPHFVEPWPVPPEPAARPARDDVVRLEILPRCTMRRTASCTCLYG